MPDLPYIKVKDIDPDKKYIVKLTSIPLNNILLSPLFMIFTVKVMNQMKKTKGVVGYTLRAKILKNDYWTLSTWESLDDVKAFVGKKAHGNSIKKMRKGMGTHKVFTWEVPGNELPMTWSRAMELAGVKKA